MRMPPKLTTVMYLSTRLQRASSGPDGMRVFDINIEQCPDCGGPLTIIAAILDPTVITKLLMHLGLSAREPTPDP